MSTNPNDPLTVPPVTDEIDVQVMNRLMNGNLDALAPREALNPVTAASQSERTLRSLSPNYDVLDRAPRTMVQLDEQMSVHSLTQRLAQAGLTLKYIKGQPPMLTSFERVGYPKGQIVPPSLEEQARQESLKRGE